MKIMENKIETKMKPDEREIALRAYELWEKGRHESGRDREHWLQAEAELLAARTLGAKSVEARPSQDVWPRRPDHDAQPKSKIPDAERRNSRSRGP